MQGGTGYVLSRKSLTLFIELGLQDNICRDYTGPLDDVQFGLCMERLGIKPSNSLDAEGKNRFFTFSPAVHVAPWKTKKLIGQGRKVRKLQIFHMIHSHNCGAALRIFFRDKT